MDIHRTIAGIEDLVPPGIPHPIVTDARGHVVLPLAHYLVTKVARNEWRSPKSAWTNAERIVDVLGYFEDNGIALADVTVADLTNFRAFKTQQGFDGKCCSPRVADQSIRAFQRFWAFGCTNGHYYDGGLVEISEYKASKSGYPDDNDIPLPTAEEIRTVLNSVRGPEDAIGLAAAFGAGLRRTEIVSLPSKIILPLSEMERASNGAVIGWLDGRHAQTKGSVNREVEIPVRLYTEMYNYLISERRRERVARANTSPKSLLVSKYGNEYRPSWLNDLCFVLEARSGIKIWPHLLRHWYATRFIEFEMPSRFGGSEIATYKRLNKLLGHVFMETTMRYVHVADNVKSRESQAESAFQDKVDAMLGQIPEFS